MGEAKRKHYGRHGKCGLADCDRAAQFAPMLCVPATGWPRDADRAAQMILMAKGCIEHVKALTPENFFGSNVPEGGGEKLKRVIEIILKQRSQIPPDFSRAWIEPIRLDGERFADFERAYEKRAK